jgi:hypothetical protein
VVHDEPCRHGLKPKPCCEQHIWPYLGTLVKKLYRCPVCGDYLMGVNPGNKGRRIVWGCFNGCDAKCIRDYLEGRGIDGTCLGAWLEDKRDMPRNWRTGTDPAVLADAARWHAVRKLSAAPGVIGRNLSLFRMCIKAIEEGAGDLAPDPESLLTDDFAVFTPLAERTGLGHPRFVLFERWLSRKQ